MDDNEMFKARTRKTKLTLEVTTYGTQEQSEKTLEKIVSELELQGFNFEVVSVETDIVMSHEERESLMVETKNVFETSEYGVEFEVAYDVVFDQETGEKNHTYEVNHFGMGMKIYHITTTPLINPKAYLRSEGSTWYLTLFEEDILSSQHPLGRIVDQTSRTF